MEADCSDTDAICKLHALNQIVKEWGRRECDQHQEFLKCRKMKTLSEWYSGEFRKMQEKLNTCQYMLIGKDLMSESLKYKNCVKDVESGYIEIVEKGFETIRNNE